MRSNQAVLPSCDGGMLATERGGRQCSTIRAADKIIGLHDSLRDAAASTDEYGGQLRLTVSGAPGAAILRYFPVKTGNERPRREPILPRRPTYAILSSIW